MLANLKHLWDQRDEVDHKEGLLAYRRYRTVMRMFAKHYGFPISDVTSAFVALSPNSDYHGNLRSLASVLDGVRHGVPTELITVSTYNACRDRAVSYVNKAVSFRKTVKGPKISAFRDNILRPNTSRLVTVDGHMIAAWHGQELTMKDAARLLKSKAQYMEISDAISELATGEGVAPCQAQAILWLARKRILNVKHESNLDLFWGKDDERRTLCSPEDFKPYERKQACHSSQNLTETKSSSLTTVSGNKQTSMFETGFSSPRWVGAISD